MHAALSVIAERALYDSRLSLRVASDGCMHALMHGIRGRRKVLFALRLFSYTVQHTAGIEREPARRALARGAL